MLLTSSLVFCFFQPVYGFLFIPDSIILKLSDVHRFYFPSYHVTCY